MRRMSRQEKSTQEQQGKSKKGKKCVKIEKSNVCHSALDAESREATRKNGFPPARE
jgi:hypothetical protein